MGAAAAVGTGALGAADVEGLYLLLTAFICSSLKAVLSVGPSAWVLCALHQQQHTIHHW